MIAYLGNLEKIVKPDSLGGNLVYARTAVYHDFYSVPKFEVIVVENDAVPNVYGLPVRVFDGKVLEMYEPECR